MIPNLARKPTPIQSSWQNKALRGTECTALHTLCQQPAGQRERHHGVSQDRSSASEWWALIRAIFSPVYGLFCEVNKYFSLKGQRHKIIDPRFSPIIHMLKYFSIWFLFCRDIRICKKLCGVISRNTELKNVQIFCKLQEKLSKPET